MQRRFMTTLATLLALFGLAGQPAAQAADIKSEKAFAEQKIVLQISDNDPSKQTLVLNVASNLVKAYGSENVDVEIVAFGPGLRLLFKDNNNKDRIQGLSAEGVRFSACGNTIKKMGNLLGEEPRLNPNATRVDAGVVRIIDLTSAGYTLVKP